MPNFLDCSKTVIKWLRDHKNLSYYNMQSIMMNLINISFQFWKKYFLKSCIKWSIVDQDKTDISQNKFWISVFTAFKTFKFFTMTSVSPTNYQYILPSFWNTLKFAFCLTFLFFPSLPFIYVLLSNSHFNCSPML